MANPSATRFAKPSSSTTAEGRFAPTTPATIAKVVTPPSIAPSHLLEKLPEERAIRLLGGAHPDRRAEIFRSLSREAQGRLFDQLNEDAKTSISRILKYPADQAGSIMTTEFVSVPASRMVKQVIDHIRSPCAQTEQIYAVYQVDPQSQRLCRQFPCVNF